MATTLCIYLFLLSVTVSFTFLNLTSCSSEAEILLSFNASIEDTRKSLASWSNNSYCNWIGITCDTASVTSINLQSLNLSGDISSSICDLPNLTELNLADDLFNQPIPLHLSQCSSLQTLNLSNNLIWGTIPSQISLFGSLRVLDFSRNHIEGNIPESLGSLKNLQVLNVGSNLLSGSVPSILRNFTELAVLDLSQNKYLNNLTGEVPLALVSSLKNLDSFDVSQNKLTGPFPNGICKGRGLINLSLHTNGFNGSISNSISECKNLERFQVQNNGFSGDFPYALWSLPKFKLIRAENNRFSGQIPESISEAVQLEQVQLDSNDFTGKIPHNLGLLKSLYRFSASLNHLASKLEACSFNVSFNQLSGNVPYSMISGLPASYLEGNPQLCGPGLPTSCSDDPPRHRNSVLTALTCALIFLSFLVGAAIVAAGFALYWRRSSKQNETGVWRSVFFYPFRITEHDLLMGMDEKLFKREWRHKNIVKILGFCHSDESILLIYEHLPKGSLGDMISQQDFELQWEVRLRIAIGVAQGLAYLHKDYNPHLLHRNLKSNNILLDANFEPKLRDFSLDRIVGEASFQSTLASAAASSCYNAPEYSYSYSYSKKASEQLDVYCFGIVLLELMQTAAICGGQRNDRWEVSQLYKGVQKAKDAPFYVAFIEDSGIISRYDQEENAAKSRDLVALKFWGTSAETNFPQSEYKDNLKTIARMSKQDVVAAVRAISRSCWRSTSRYRGVSRNQYTGKWQANVSLGHRNFFLGVFRTEEEAAIAYDIEIIKWSGERAVTNFDINLYDVRAIVDSFFPQEDEWEVVDTTLSLEMKEMDKDNNCDATTSTFGWALRGYNNKRMKIGESYDVPRHLSLSLAFNHSPTKPFKISSPSS
ncbi:hypothetical protein L6164_009418 [Bauhinia variegata]|uniref:Uncharacterized protein n=1 Tax=Bauhinia variegata TaxID=167791 RepID=A0ACB9PJV4_BAUVA|nr:hypothetical protein L6164_009418 [Bauhinia variegata]